MLLMPNASWETAQNVVYDGNHGIDTVMEVTDPTFHSNNLTFFGESDATPFGTAPVLYSSRPNDQVGGAGTAGFMAFTGLAADAQGRVYVAWQRNQTYSGGTGDAVYVSTSLDQGHTWARRVRASAVNDSGADFNAQDHVAPDGRVWVAYSQYWGGVWGITFVASADHGSTFSAPRNVTNFPAGYFGENFDFAVDAQGRIHLAYNWCTESLCSLSYTWSDDGVVWSPPVVLVNASPSGPTTLAWDPSIAVVGSVVHLDWYDSRLTPTGSFSQYYARSTDRGATWSVPIPINQGLSVALSWGARLAAFGDTVMAVWGAAGGFAWAVSVTAGATWYPEQNQPMTPGLGVPMIAVDGNGTFHVAASGDATPTTPQVYQLSWSGPPDAPTAVTIASSDTRSLRVNWTAPAQGDVGAYEIWRSPDGSTYSLVATVAAPATNWMDTGLADGTYWYKVDAVDTAGLTSHDAVPASGTVGPPGSGPGSGSQALLDALSGQLTLVTVLLVVVLVVVAVETVLLLRQMRRPKPPASGPTGSKPPEDDL